MNGDKWGYDSIIGDELKVWCHYSLLCITTYCLCVRTMGGGEGRKEKVCVNYSPYPSCGGGEGYTCTYIIIIIIVYSVYVVSILNKLNYAWYNTIGMCLYIVITGTQQWTIHLFIYTQHWFPVLCVLYCPPPPWFPWLLIPLLTIGGSPGNGSPG